MEPKTEQALLRAVCTLIDTGRFELGKEETDDPTEQAVVDFMRQLRIGSQVSYGGAPNSWNLDIVRSHAALAAALETMVQWYEDDYRRHGGERRNLPELEMARAALKLAER